VNGAHDATDLVAKLRAYHHAAQTNPDKAKFKHTGLDLDTGMFLSCLVRLQVGMFNHGWGRARSGKCRDNVKAGVLEPAMSKVKMIRFATEVMRTC